MQEPAVWGIGSNIVSKQAVQAGILTGSGCWRPLMRQNFNKKVGVSLYYFYFDSGTTNTRACLLKDRTIICRGDIPVGSRDSALHQNRTVLISALKQLYDQLLS